MRVKSREEAMIEVFAYIEIWYNRKRKHSALGYKTPLQMEKMSFNLESRKAA